MASLYEHHYWTSPDGLKLHCRQYSGPENGEKTPVLCMHGLTRNARDFAPLAAHIAKTRRVLVPEMRGRGLSEYAKDTGTYNPLTYVADVRALLAEQGIEQVIAIGTSMGGLMTMLMAAQDSGNEEKLLAGAVLNDIGPEIDPEGIARIGDYVGQGGSFPSWMHASRALKDTHSDAFPDYGLDQWLEMAKRTLIVGQNGRISFDYDLGIAEPFKQLGDAATPDLWPAFDALKDVPLLLVRGAISDLLSKDVAKKMGEIHGSMKLATVPRVGHAPMLDEPEAITAIDALLESLS